ncbi:hypothetical protein Cgig2_013627 [Carnegiea gigantea]|uniref:EF-hand domain-containing protein n=1 Tax=Carnegiea gigantea TaxID=171969 RepID=A0A9Q1KBU0_9CARY|nr:hypothetical protein Cgig2_013627 [Carnegiea gigantea]
MQGYAGYNYGTGAGDWGQVQQEQYYGYGSYGSYKKPTCPSPAMQDPFEDIAPTAFPSGIDPKVVNAFNRIDCDGNGVIDDQELQTVLTTSCGHKFSLRTVHLLMHEFTHSNKRMIGPKEFVPLYHCLQQWRGIFQRFDRNRNGSIESQELAQALASLGYKVSPQIISLLVSKFSRSAGGRCCITVKGLTEAFKAKEDMYGRATFGHEEFLLTVLPFIIA